MLAAVVTTAEMQTVCSDTCYDPNFVGDGDCDDGGGEGVAQLGGTLAGPRLPEELARLGGAAPGGLAQASGEFFATGGGDALGVVLVQADDHWLVTLGGRGPSACARGYLCAQEAARGGDFETGWVNAPCQ